MAVAAVPLLVAADYSVAALHYSRYYTVDMVVDNSFADQQDIVVNAGCFAAAVVLYTAVPGSAAVHIVVAVAAAAVNLSTHHVDNSAEADYAAAVDTAVV